MSLRESVLDVVESMEDEYKAGGSQNLKSYAMMLRVALKAAEEPAPSLKVYVPPARQPDYDKTFAQAIQARSRREAEQRLLVDEGVDQFHTYVLSGGPDHGVYVNFPEALPEGSTVEVASQSYTVRGSTLICKLPE